MKILFSPVVSNEKIVYVFGKDTIKATHKNKTDIFDFSSVPDGVMPIFDDNGDFTVQTILEVNPIISAKRVDGELWVELINFIGTVATHNERYPQWIDYKDYKEGGVNG